MDSTAVKPATFTESAVAAGFDGLSETDLRKLREEIEDCVPELGYEWTKA